jgi:hypothetical protein
MKKLILFLTTLSMALLPLFCFGQGEASQWLWQGTLLKFSPNAHTTIPALQPVPNSISSLAFGNSSIADKEGNLLFYSDGQNVYNNQHQIMDNGTGLRSCAARTNCNTDQTVLIVPNPAAPHLYYLFQNDVYIDGLFYSMIDMRQNNGKGKVIEKNRQLRSKTGQGMAATIGADCQSYWLLTNDWTKTGYYYAYKITANGIQPPVETTLSNQYSQDANMYITFSMQGNKVAMHEERSPACLYEFNQQTGKLTNRIELPYETAGGIPDFFFRLMAQRHI